MWDEAGRPSSKGETTRRGAARRRREQRRQGNASARAGGIGAARRRWCSTGDIGTARCRWSLPLKSSEPRHRKVGNGMEDSGAREGPAATGGEKPLKGGCPWTNQHETRLADPRHGKSREGMPGRSACSRKAARDGHVSVDWQASEGPNGDVTCGGRASGGNRRSSDDAEGSDGLFGGRSELRKSEMKACSSKMLGGLACQIAEHPPMALSRAVGRRGRPRGRPRRSWSEDCGGQAPNAYDKGMRGWWYVQS